MLKLKQGKICRPLTSAFASQVLTISEKGDFMTESNLAKETRWIYSELGDDPELRDLVQLFVDEMPSRISTFEDLLREGKWDELRRSAHQLKGAAGSYGYGSLTAAAAAVEQAIRQELPFEEVRSRLEELVDLCQRARVTPDG